MDPLTMALLGSVASSAISGGAGLFGSMSASKQQQASQGQNIANTDMILNKIAGMVHPFQQGGVQALGSLQSLLGFGGKSGAGAMDFLKNIPGFQSVLNYGINNTQNKYTAEGLGTSPNAMRAVNSFGTDYAANNAFFPLIQSLLGVEGQGVNATNSFGGTAANFNNALTGANTAYGNAGAAGTLGATNAIGTAANSLGNNFSQYQMLNALLGGGSGVTNMNLGRSGM